MATPSGMTFDQFKEQRLRAEFLKLKEEEETTRRIKEECRAYEEKTRKWLADLCGGLTFAEYIRQKVGQISLDTMENYRDEGIDGFDRVEVIYERVRSLLKKETKKFYVNGGRDRLPQMVMKHLITMRHSAPPEGKIIIKEHGICVMFNLKKEWLGLAYGTGHHGYCQRTHVFMKSDIEKLPKYDFHGTKELAQAFLQLAGHGENDAVVEIEEIEGELTKACAPTK